MDVNDTVSHQNARKRTAIDAVIHAKNAEAFFDAWAFLGSEYCKKDNDKEVLLHGQEDDIEGSSK